MAYPEQCRVLKIAWAGQKIGKSKKRRKKINQYNKKKTFSFTFSLLSLSPLPFLQISWPTFTNDWEALTLFTLWILIWDSKGSKDLISGWLHTEKISWKGCRHHKLSHLPSIEIEQVDKNIWKGTIQMPGLLPVLTGGNQDRVWKHCKNIWWVSSKKRKKKQTYMEPWAAEVLPCVALVHPTSLGSFSPSWRRGLHWLLPISKSRIIKKEEKKKRAIPFEDIFPEWSS